MARLVPASGTLGDNGEPLGYALVGFTAGSSSAVLLELYVAPEYRTVGLGSALLEASVDEATARGCTGIESVALPGDRSTKNFFEDHSMVARAILVHRDIGPRTDQLVRHTTGHEPGS